VGVRERGDQFRRLAQSAVTDLFDQRSPFGRLALTHVLMTAGDTMFAVSLAGSLFFSISPTAAKDKVLLYLLLTVGPFAVAAPALGPVIDRSRGARRATVVASALGRALLCPFLAQDIHSLLLFPEAFAMLVLSKVYVVTKGALVPEMAALGMLDSAIGTTGSTGTDGANSDPSRPSDPADGESAVPPASAPLARGPDPTPPYGMPLVRVDDPGSGAEKIEPDLATLNARLGLLASLSGFAFALPAVAILKLGGSDGASAVLWPGPCYRCRSGGASCARSHRAAPVAREVRPWNRRRLTFPPFSSPRTWTTPGRRMPTTWRPCGRWSIPRSFWP
jgi:hypothetical protein